MSMDGGVIVHCPRCGVAFCMIPAVDQVSFHGTTMRMTFCHVDTDHKCGLP